MTGTVLQHRQDQLQTGGPHRQGICSGRLAHASVQPAALAENSVFADNQRFPARTSPLTD